MNHTFCPQGLNSSFLISGVHSLCLPLSFWCYSFLPPLFNSCGEGLGSRESHTQGCATVKLECSSGSGGTGLDFPMPIVNCWLYLKLWGDLHCPLDPSLGPWPLAQKLCRLPCWDSQWTVCVCVVCVNGQSQ